jgi:hypothetical protein
MTGSEIATIDLVAVSAAGERRPVRLRLAAPASEGTGSWACLLALEGLYGRPMAVRGEDALQALCLALALAARLLREVAAGGGRLELPDGDEFPFDAYFGRLADPGAPAT